MTARNIDKEKSENVAATMTVERNRLRKLMEKGNTRVKSERRYKLRNISKYYLNHFVISNPGVHPLQGGQDLPEGQRRLRKHNTRALEYWTEDIQMCLLSINQSIHPSINQSINQSTNQSVCNQSIRHSNYLICVS